MVKSQFLVIFVFLNIFFVSCSAHQVKDTVKAASGVSAKIEKVTWYWLNSSSPREWEQDFKDIKESGIDRVVLWYGWNASWMATEASHTLKALDLCKNIGLETYLGIWSGTIMDPSNQPKLEDFKLMNEKGAVGKGFNLFSQAWIQNWYLNYLTKIQKAYGDHPAVKGYYLDDTLALEAGSKSVGYGPQMRNQFIAWLKARFKTLDQLNESKNSSLGNWEEIKVPLAPAWFLWSEWNIARSQWIQNWAKITRDTLKTSDAKQELIFSDFHTVIDSKLPAFGISWADITPYFTRIMAYNINVSEPGFIQKRVSLLKELTESKIPLSWGMFTFVIGQKRSEANVSPSVEEFERQLTEIRSQNISGIDFYAYRVGDWSFPISELKNKLLGPENPATLLKYRSDLKETILNQ